jgi:Flp pilus assembly protein TadD
MRSIGQIVGRRLAAFAVGSLLAVFHGVAAEPAVASPTFHEHIAPLLFRHCAPCHRPGQSAPFSLLSFGDAQKHARDLADVTARRFMPPWLPAPGHGEFVGERRLIDAEIATFRNWHAAGAPEGDLAKAPPVPVWPSDWQLGPPDLIVKMPAPYTVPAAGRDVYRHFVLPVKLDRRRFVAAWEFRPHSRAVHHMFVRVDRSGEGRRRDATDPEPGFPGMDTPTGIQSPDGHFASWQPGAAPRRNPPGLPFVLEPGSDFVLQMHLQPLGKPDELQAEVGLYFTDQPPTNQPVKIALNSYAIEIPPGSTNVTATDEFTLPADADLLGLLPHTHYLGRRIEARAFLPGGAERSLLLIPDWDFNWQGDYICREPVFLPTGTRVTMRISFDNSTNNVRNPANPPRLVRFGSNTTDEMAELWLQILPRTPAGAAQFARANLERTTRDTIAYNEQRLRANPADGPALVNLGRALLALRRHEDAWNRFNQAVKVAPELDDAHYYVGLMHRLAGRREEAIAEFNRTLQLNPGYVRAHGNLGLLHVEAGRVAPAERHFSEAVRLDPTDALAHGTLGAIRLQQGRVAEAEKLLQRAVELDPGDANVLKNLGAARRLLGRP